MSEPSISNSFLYGLNKDHLVEFNQYLFEAETAKSFESMVKDAKEDDISIAVCSSHRSFITQQKIWDNKSTGKRAVLDKESDPIDISNLSEPDLVRSILMWSALPGTSRHHWGTDIDIFDSNHISKSQLQLIPQEYEKNGPCKRLSQWLDLHASRYGFYRPYQAGKSGVSPEPWHISYAAKSTKYMELYDVNDLRKILKHHKIELYSSVENQLDNIIKEYFYRVASADQIEV